LAAAFIDSTAPVPITLCRKQTADEFHDPLHNTQVVHDRHQSGEEDDDRQHVDRKTEADNISVGERPKHHVDASLGIADYFEDAGTQRVNDGPASIEVKNERGNCSL
jgi:hypothetical protein